MRILDRYAANKILIPPFVLAKRGVLTRLFYRLIGMYTRFEIRRKRILGKPMGPGMFGECPTGPKEIDGPSSGNTHSTSDLDRQTKGE